jgi:8-oxo-dGTP pyrophosphatase MutT (NUDIX family)
MFNKPVNKMTDVGSKVNEKQAACVLCVDPTSKLVLAVSRKNDSQQFGLPGGKCDPGESFIEAAAREFSEETMYEISTSDLLPVFKAYSETDGYTTETFMLPFKYFNPISSKTLAAHETGVVRWVGWDVLFNGPFGDYNKQLYVVVGDLLKADKA